MTESNYEITLIFMSELFFCIKPLTEWERCSIITSVKFFWFTPEGAVSVMAKDLSVSVLLDFYGELLTPKQAEALDLYYNQDLSLAEIAQGTGVSRQGVRAFIKQGEGHLAEFEEKLGMAKRFADISKLVTDIEALLGEDNKEITEKINEIKRRL